MIAAAPTTRSTRRGSPPRAGKAAAGKLYGALDVSSTSTHMCVVDAFGNVVAEAVAPTDPDSIAKVLRAQRRRLEVVAQETGSLAVWLHRELVRHRLPMMCLDARLTRAALAGQRNKTDRNDARDIAILISRGFRGCVHIKSDHAHRLRLLLTCRRVLKRKAIDLQMTLTKSLKIFGLAPEGFSDPDIKRRHLSDPLMDKSVLSVMRAHATMLTEVAALDKLVKKLAREDSVCRRLMTVPGVGPLTALAYRAAIDDPTRFRNSKVVAAYFGLTPRLIQSGQSSFAGGVSKLGDQGVRAALYEAAMVMLVHSKTPSSLRAWGLKLVAARGHKFAAVACARKLAVLLHRLWITKTDFQPAPA